MAAVEQETGRIHLTQSGRFGDLRTKSYRPFEEGDVLFAKITPCMENGKVAIAEGLTARVGFGSTEFHVLRPGSEVSARYLLAFMLQPSFRREARANMAGAVGQMRVPAKFLANSYLPMPPRDEQDRIVAAIEEELSRIEAAAASVTHAEVQMTRWKNAYLGHVLRADQGGWTTAELGQLLSDARYGTSARSVRGDAGTPVLRIPNIQRGRVDFSDLKVVAEPNVNLDSAWALPGDVLTIRSNGSRSLIGRAAVVPQLHRSIAFASYLIALTPSPTAMVPEFLALALDGPDCRQQLEGMAASSAGQYNLSAGKLRRLRVSLPALVQQQRVVAEFRDFAIRTDGISGAISRTLGRTRALRQAILSEAFSGAWADAA